jgi:hypothetical protein
MGVLLLSRIEAGREVDGERVEFIVLVEPRRLRLKLGRGDAIDIVECASRWMCDILSCLPSQKCNLLMSRVKFTIV